MNERLDQKSRTREALLAAARALIGRGDPVTVAAVAGEAGMSKATAYRYFSDPSVLAAEAGLAVEVRAYDDITAGAVGPREKVRAVSLYILDLSLDHEAAFRNFLARNLDAWIAEGGRLRERRGARRVAMFDEALAGTGLPPAERVALIHALTAATGTEAMIALLDVAGTDTDGARVAVLTIADALLDKYLGPAILT